MWGGCVKVDVVWVCYGGCSNVGWVCYGGCGVGVVMWDGCVMVDVGWVY